MEESIEKLLHAVGVIFMVPVVIVMVFMVIAVPATGVKKILGAVVQERRDRQHTKSS